MISKWNTAWQVAGEIADYLANKAGGIQITAREQEHIASIVFERRGKEFDTRTQEWIPSPENSRIAACTGVAFTDADPTGAVKALAEALEPFLNVYEERPGETGMIEYLIRATGKQMNAARAALARVRLDETATKGETK